MRAAWIGAGLVGGVAVYLLARARAEMLSGASDGEDEFFGAVQVAMTQAGGVNNRAVSMAGVEFIKRFESFRAYPYETAKGNGDWTIGYGHKIKPGESFTVVGEAEAVRLLQADLRMAEGRVNGSISYALNQVQFDALSSLAFNLRWASWKLAAARLNAGENVAGVIGRYTYAGAVQMAGLVRRRAAEIALYTMGKYA
jgi:GH24 family phage-related lysozyme (muramidase)